jgi:K+-sensing histidine kinase KdpD
MSDEDVILSRVGHDLRGELATIVAGIHYLLRYEEGISEAGRGMLERVNGAGGRLRRLLDELELAAWIGGRPPGPMQRDACRLPSLVEGALGRIERHVVQRGVSVRTTLPTDLPAFEGDPELLGAAVEYAIDFAVSRSPGRSVAVSATGPSRLLVADEGGPVDADLLARLFEPFVEKEVIPRPAPGARRRERLGLGLAIARGIATAHGGSFVAALAADGKGLVLSCNLTMGGCAPQTPSPGLGSLPSVGSLGAL